MNDQLLLRIKEDPNYKELIAKRESFTWKLSILMLIIYYGFILTVAFMPQILAKEIYGVVTLGIPIGIFIIVISFILTGVYVNKANREFDSLVDKVNKHARSEV